MKIEIKINDRGPVILEFSDQLISDLQQKFNPLDFEAEASKIIGEIIVQEIKLL